MQFSFLFRNYLIQHFFSLSFSFLSSSGNLATASQNVVFPAGSENRVCVDWPIVDDSTSGGDQTISISISPPSIPGVVIGDVNTSNITIKDDDGRHLHVHAANNIYASNTSIYANYYNTWQKQESLVSLGGEFSGYFIRHRQY